jgi:hypothetical protein
MIMQITEQGYRVISRITSVQQPVIISKQKTNGYPDLIVYTAGGGIPTAYRYLEFNGKTYPNNASTAPILPKGIEVSGIVLASRITPDLAAPLVAV